MPPDSPSSDSSAQELMDAEIEIGGLKVAADEKTLSEALAKLPGIRSFNLSDGVLAIEYDPVQVVMAKIKETIVRAGFQATDIASSLASPIGDALHHEES